MWLGLYLIVDRVEIRTMYFDYWRPNGGPTQFFQVSIPVTFDPYLLTFTFAVIVISVAFLLIIPGFRGITRLYFFVRVYLSVYILWVILVGGCGQNWEEAYLRTRAPYKTFSERIINASLGVKIGLSSVNVTMKTNPIYQQIEKGVEEIIDYNERLEWKWRQGREGYGTFSGQVQQDYRSMQYGGAPLPILWIAEYFTIDEEYIRWGRSYRTAGWYTWVTLWVSLPMWAMANLLSLVVSFYAGVLFIVTGALMLISTVIWATLRWGSWPMTIVFQDGTLEPYLGGSFYLVLSGGLVSCIYGITILALDTWAPQAIADFFGLDVLKDGEQFQRKTEDEPVSDDLEARQSMRRRFRRRIIQRIKPTQRRRARPEPSLKFRNNHDSVRFSNDVFETAVPDEENEEQSCRSSQTTVSSREPPPSYRETSVSEETVKIVDEENDLYVRTRV